METPNSLCVKPQRDSRTALLTYVLCRYGCTMARVVCTWYFAQTCTPRASV
jgi:hypothetical protein